MADLEISVGVQGAQVATADLDRVGAAGTRTARNLDAAARSAGGVGDSFARLGQKLRSGEVLRNAAQSAVFLGMQSERVSDKIAALSGALAAVPGPIGAISAALAVGASGWSAYSRSAEEAAKRAAQAAADIAAATRARDEAQAAVAGRASSVAGSVGQTVRAATAAGVDPTGGTVQRFQRLAPGDPRAAVEAAIQLAESKLDATGREAVFAALEAAKRAGGTIDAEARRRTIDEVRYQQEAATGLSIPETERVAGARAMYAARGGGLPMGGGMRPQEDRISAATDALAAALGTGVDAAQKASNRIETMAARATEYGLASAERPAVESATRDLADATAIAGNATALRALDAAASSTAGRLGGLAGKADAAAKALDAIRRAAARDAAPAKPSGWTFRNPFSAGDE